MRRTRGVRHLRWAPWCRVPAGPHVARAPCLGTPLGAQHAQNARSAAPALGPMVQSASRATRCACALPRHPRRSAACTEREECCSCAGFHGAECQQGHTLRVRLAQAPPLGAQHAQNARSAAPALGFMVQSASRATRCACALPRHPPRSAACAEREECGTCAGAHGAECQQGHTLRVRLA